MRNFSTEVVIPPYRPILYLMSTTDQPTAEAVRDRAYEILTRQGIHPLDASQTLWSMACETARSELAVEAARARREMFKSFGWSVTE